MAYLGASLIGKAIGLLTTPFFTRLVSEEEYGILTLYLTVLGGASVICSAFSSGSAIYRGLGKFEDKCGAFIKSALLVSTGFSLGICILLFAFWGYIGLPSAFFVPLALQILCDGVVGVSLARARYRYSYFEVMLISILTSALPALLSILILARARAAFGVRIYIMLAVSLILAVVQLLRLLRLPGGPEKAPIKYMITSAFPLLPHSLSVALCGQADKLFVTRIMGAAALAKYSVVHSLGVALQFAVSALGSSLGPWIIRRLEADERDRIERVVGILFALLAALSLGLCSIAPEAMTLLAPGKYHEALPALFPIAISTPLTLISFVTTVALVNAGKGRYTAVISLMGLILSVTLNYTLISAFGYFGAGLTLLISQIASVFLGFVFLKSAELNNIMSPSGLCACFSFSVLIGVLTNLLYGHLVTRLLLLLIPAAWCFVSLFKCREILFEREALPQND